MIWTSQFDVQWLWVQKLGSQQPLVSTAVSLPIVGHVWVISLFVDGIRRFIYLLLGISPGSYDHSEYVICHLLCYPSLRLACFPSISTTTTTQPRTMNTGYKPISTETNSIIADLNLSEYHQQSLDNAKARKPPSASGKEAMIVIRLGTLTMSALCIGAWIATAYGMETGWLPGMSSVLAVIYLGIWIDSERYERKRKREEGMDSVIADLKLEEHAHQGLDNVTLDNPSYYSKVITYLITPVSPAETAMIMLRLGAFFMSALCIGAWIATAYGVETGWLPGMSSVVAVNSVGCWIVAERSERKRKREEGREENGEEGGRVGKTELEAGWVSEGD